MCLIDNPKSASYSRWLPIYYNPGHNLLEHMMIKLASSIGASQMFQQFWPGCYRLGYIRAFLSLDLVPLGSRTLYAFPDVWKSSILGRRPPHRRSLGASLLSSCTLDSRSAVRRSPPLITGVKCSAFSATPGTYWCSSFMISVIPSVVFSLCSNIPKFTCEIENRNN